MHLWIVITFETAPVTDGESINKAAFVHVDLKVVSIILTSPVVPIEIPPLFLVSVNSI